MKNYVLIFGAAVRSNGRPSAALRRRVDLALRCAANDPDAMIIPTGGVGGEGPAEAEVIKNLLVEAGIKPSRIIMELKGRDTLESIRLCHVILQERGDCQRVVCCTSSYHQPRCAFLLRLLGYRVDVPKVSGSLGRLSRIRHARLLLKEVVALPYDAVLLMAKRRSPLP
jgi:uncharacterized SAM-binding protein YcdF (DUF218 family)